VPSGVGVRLSPSAPIWRSRRTGTVSRLKPCAGLRRGTTFNHIEGWYYYDAKAEKLLKEGGAENNETISQNGMSGSSGNRNRLHSIKNVI